MKKKKFLIFCLCGGFAMMTFAQQTDSISQQKLSLTLNDAQIYAVAHNRTLKNASLDIQKAEATRWQTIATMLPQVTAQFDYQNMCGYEIDFGGGKIPMDPSGTLALSTSLTLSGGQIIGVFLGNIAMRMSDITLKKTEQQIKDQVKTLYYSALVIEQTIDLLELNLINVESLLISTEKSVEVGVAEQVDADKLSVQVATMQTQINSIKRSAEMSYNSLRLQLGVSTDTDLTLIQTIDDLLNVETAFALLSEELILNNNYDYQLLKQNVDLTKQQVKQKEWAYGPQVSAFYNYSYKTYFDGDAGLNMTPPNMVGVSVSMPIFSSGNKFESVREAKINHAKQLNTLADSEDALKVQHSQLRYNLSSSYENFEIQKKNIAVSQRVFDNITEKYNYGVASSLEVTNSSTNLITAQSSYVQALLEFVNAQISLEQLLNK